MVKFIQQYRKHSWREGEKTQALCSCESSLTASSTAGKMLLWRESCFPKVSESYEPLLFLWPKAAGVYICVAPKGQNYRLWNNSRTLFKDLITDSKGFLVGGVINWVDFGF